MQGSTTVQKKEFFTKEAIQYGWAMFKANVPFFVGIFLIVGANSIIGRILVFSLRKDYLLLSDLIQVISWIVGSLFSIGLVKIALSFYDHKKSEYSDLWSHYRLLLSYIVGSILYGLVFSVGLILLVIPGLIFFVKFHFYSYYIVDKGLGPIEALKKSSALTHGVKKRLYIFFGTLFVLNLLGALALLVGLFATVPVTILADAFVYRKLLEQTEG